MPIAKRLFGTDGVRGKANVELTVELAIDLARAAGEGLAGPVIVGRDTRRSGDMLSLALQAGFHSVGVEDQLVEVRHLTHLGGTHLICDLAHR